MIVGILGKGGSGKSTVSTLLTYHALQNNKKVLAIDADHNMDFAFNLAGVDAEIPYYGPSLFDLKLHCNASIDSNYRDIIRTNNSTSFSAFLPDAYTERYSLLINDRLRVMAAGPHTEDVLSDKSCSHSLFTPLKIFLPLLSLEENTTVIVDEKAGTDGAGTGIPTGFTMAVIVAEPTPYGIKSANQIADLLRHYETPFVCLLNKVRPETDISDFIKKLPAQLIGVLPFDANLSQPTSDYKDSSKVFENIFNFGKNILSQDGDTRTQRTRAKFDQK